MWITSTKTLLALFVIENSELNATNIWGKVEVQFKVEWSGTKVAEPILIVNECQIGKLLLFLSFAAQVCSCPLHQVGSCAKPHSVKSEVNSLGSRKISSFEVLCVLGSGGGYVCVMCLFHVRPSLLFVCFLVMFVSWIDFLEKPNEPQKWLKGGSRSSGPGMWQRRRMQCAVVLWWIVNWFKMCCATSPYLNPRKLSNILRNFWILNRLFLLLNWL